MSEKLKLYHNPRCRKSREAVTLLNDKNVSFETVLYLKDLPTEEEITWIFKNYGGDVNDLVRKNETIWKSSFKGKTMTTQQLIEAVSEYPILLERPILISNNQVVLGRPLENISNFL